MATNTVDFEEHKRKIFFERLGAKTTRQTLSAYLSGFDIQVCAVPSDEGKNRGYGLVIFRKESSVNAVMSKRPHYIDGQCVEVYRSVPDQGSLKENKGIRELIVSGFKTGSINKTDLEKYFCGFGQINNIDMKYTDDSCCIEFEDYDSVDKALLDRPHIIKNIELELRKASRKGRMETLTPPKTTQPAGISNSNTIPKKSSLKQVTIDPEVSTLNIQKKVYCVHVTNLPSKVDAEYLSTKFSIPMGNILMDSPNENSSTSIECWLKGFDDKQAAEQVVEDWNGQRILGSRIDCDVTEDRLELCNKFRTGECSKTSEVCDWEHIKCTANGKCSNECPYGHREGVKSAIINDPQSSHMYQIRIIGFQKKLTPDILSQILGEKKCFVKRSQDSVGYIGPIRTMKYARRLLEKWHNRSVDGQMLHCQIELNERPFVPKTLSRPVSMSNLASKENGSSHLGRNHQAKNDSRISNQHTSPSRDDSDSDIRILNDTELNCEPRLYQRSREDIIKQEEVDIKRKTKSTEVLPSSTNHRSLILHDISGSSRKTTKIRKITDHGSYASLIEYNRTDKEIRGRELNALQLLKDVKGVIQLIELRSPLNDKRYDYTDDLSIITQYPEGVTLKKHVNEVHRGGLGVLQAVQLVQNLAKIVQRVHANGVLHRNLGPESIFIEWDSKKTSADEVELMLVDFSQACIKSDKTTPMNQSTLRSWYKAPQADIESFRYTSTIDASSICAILLWLLADVEPGHDQNVLPHQQDNVMDKLDNKIGHTVRSAKQGNKLALEESQLKRYLVDTFNIGFGYPDYQPWTITDLECRLASIQELLLPRDPKLDTIDVVFKDLASAQSTRSFVPSTRTNIHPNIFQRAAIAFQEAKTKFCVSNDQYSWSDGGCTWLDTTQTPMNERRHDDILTFNYRDGRDSRRCSIIITCLATLTDEENCITLSISSTANGRVSRIPIGCYGKGQDFTPRLQKSFIIELNNLIKSIARERKVVSD